MISHRELPSVYTPKSFSPHQYETLRALCQAIIPADIDAGGAIEAGVPELLDLIASENAEYQLKLGRGILWLDSACMERYGQTYMACFAAEQREILHLIAFRENAEKDSRLGTGIEFFSVLRRATVHGFFTSEIGAKYLGCSGEAHPSEFPDYPDMAEA